MKPYLTKKWLAIILVNFISIVSLSESLERRILDEYSFILLMPQADNQLVAAVFMLDDLRVCRFPNGPMWSNSLAIKKLHPISAEIYTEIKSRAQKLHVLCLDYSNFKMRCQNECQQSICGFALPWEPGMAYVFDDLQNIEQVTGFLIEKSQLAYLQLNDELKKNRSLSSADLDLDEIDLLIAENTDSEYVGKYLPYPLQDIKNLLGKIVISCLIHYHEIRQKIINLIGSRNHARSKT